LTEAATIITTRGKSYRMRIRKGTAAPEDTSAPEKGDPPRG
jgi:hypothetical protein